jgi:hypothetical protein
MGPCFIHFYLRFTEFPAETFLAMLRTWVIFSFALLPLLAQAGKGKDCAEEYGRIEGLIAAGFKMPQEAALPPKLTLQTGRKEGKFFLNVAQRIWKKHWPRPDLIQALEAADAAGGKLPPETVSLLNKTRGRLKTIRFLCEAICKDHEAPKHLDHLTVVLGHLSDAHDFAVDTRVEPAELKEVLKLLKSDYMDKVAKDIRDMKAASGKSNLDWLEKAREQIQGALDSDKVIVDQFHEARKNIGRLQTVLLFEGMRDNDQQKLATVAWLSRLYMKLGGEHDVLVKQSYQEVQDPDLEVLLEKISERKNIDTIDFSPEAREWLQDALKASD